MQTSTLPLWLKQQSTGRTVGQYNRVPLGINDYGRCAPFPLAQAFTPGWGWGDHSFLSPVYGASWRLEPRASPVNGATSFGATPSTAPSGCQRCPPAKPGAEGRGAKCDCTHVGQTNGPQPPASPGDGFARGRRSHMLARRLGGNCRLIDNVPVRRAVRTSMARHQKSKAIVFEGPCTFRP